MNIMKDRLEDNFENYIFSLKNIISYTNLLTNQDEEPKNEKQNILFSNGLFCPPHIDKLFWCFYLIKYGMNEYEMIGNHFFEIEKKTKFMLIEEVRKHKNVLKANQFKPINSFEDDLANNKVITLKTFMALMCLENKNIVYMNEKKIYISERNHEDSTYYILYKRENNVPYYEVDLNGTKDLVEKLKEENVVVPSYMNHLKSASAYKVEELKEMCDKFEIVLPHNKKLLKNDLYELIKHFF